MYANSVSSWTYNKKGKNGGGSMNKRNSVRTWRTQIVQKTMLPHWISEVWHCRPSLDANGGHSEYLQIEERDTSQSLSLSAAPVFCYRFAIKSKKELNKRGKNILGYLYFIYVRKTTKWVSGVSNYFIWGGMELLEVLMSRPSSFENVVRQLLTMSIGYSHQINTFYCVQKYITLLIIRTRYPKT